MVLTLLGEPVTYAIFKERRGVNPFRLNRGQRKCLRPADFSQHPTSNPIRKGGQGVIVRGVPSPVKSFLFEREPLEAPLTYLQQVAFSGGRYRVVQLQNGPAIKFDRT